MLLVLVGGESSLTRSAPSHSTTDLCGSMDLSRSMELCACANGFSSTLLSCPFWFLPVDMWLSLFDIASCFTDLQLQSNTAAWETAYRALEGRKQEAEAKISALEVRSVPSKLQSHEAGGNASSTTEFSSQPPYSKLPLPPYLHY